MTDNEIIKALECCAISKECGKCPAYEPTERCISTLQKNARDLINRYEAKIKKLEGKVVIQQGLLNRQQAEIERLKKRDETAEKIIREQADTILRLKDENSRLSKKCENSVVALIAAKAEAVKEFAERLKPLSRNLYPFSDEPIIDCKQIDNLVKEMVGEG